MGGEIAQLATAETTRNRARVLARGGGVPLKQQHAAHAPGEDELGDGYAAHYLAGQIQTPVGLVTHTGHRQAVAT